MHEHTDRPLRGEKVRGVIHHMAEMLQCALWRMSIMRVIVATGVGMDVRNH